MRLLFLFLFLVFCSVPVSGQSATLGVGDTTVNAGDPATVQVTLTNDTACDGFSLGASHDPAFVLASVVQAAGIMISDPPDFFDANIFTAGFTLGVVQDLGATLTPIPVGTDQVVADAIYLTNIVGTTHTPVLLVPTLGSPAVPLLAVFDQGLTEVVPTISNGCITLLGTATFQRGDANGNGSLNIADPILIAGHLFGAQVSVCDDADDANDDGALDIADAVYVLSYLFSMGAEPPPPFGVCGADVLADELGCDDGGCP